MDLGLTSSRLLTRSWVAASRLLTCGLIAVLASCYRYVNLGPPPDARTAALDTWRRLEQLESFRFRLDYRGSAPLFLGAGFTGVWQRPDREWWSGFRKRGNEVDKVELRAAGEAQYEKQAGGWRKTVRGVETRILEQVKQVVEDRDMTLQDSSAASYVYAFEPRLPILDPARQSVFSGRLEILRSNGLPGRMLCRDSTGLIEWSLRFDRFNRAGMVAVPFVAVQVMVIEPEMRLRGSRLGQAVKTLRARLDTLGWEYTLRRRQGKLVLALDRKPSSGAMALLLAAGRVELGTAARSADSGLQVGDDAAFRVTIGSLFARNGDWSVTAETGPLPGPRIVFAPPGSGQQRFVPAGDSLAALLLDGRILDCAQASSDGRLVFTGLGTKESASVLAAVASLPPSPAAFRIISSRQ